MIALTIRKWTSRSTAKTQHFLSTYCKSAAYFIDFMALPQQIKSQHDKVAAWQSSKMTKLIQCESALLTMCFYDNTAAITDQPIQFTLLGETMTLFNFK